MRGVISGVSLFLAVFLCPMNAEADDAAGESIRFLEPFVGTWSYSIDLESFYGEGGKSTTKGTWVAAFSNDGKSFSMIGGAEVGAEDFKWVLGYDAMQKAFRAEFTGNGAEAESYAFEWFPARRLLKMSGVSADGRFQLSREILILEDDSLKMTGTVKTKAGGLLVKTEGVARRVPADD